MPVKVNRQIVRAFEFAGLAEGTHGEFRGSRIVENAGEFLQQGRDEMRGGRTEHLGKLLESVPHLLVLGFRHLFRPFNVGNQVKGVFGVVWVSHDRPGGETNGAGPAATHLAGLRLGLQTESAHDKGFGGQKSFGDEPHHGDATHQGGKRNNRHNIRWYGSIGRIIVGARGRERQHTTRCHNVCGIHVLSSSLL